MILEYVDYTYEKMPMKYTTIFIAEKFKIFIRIFVTFFFLLIFAQHIDWGYIYP